MTSVVLERDSELGVKIFKEWEKAIRESVIIAIRQDIGW